MYIIKCYILEDIDATTKADDVRYLKAKHNCLMVVDSKAATRCGSIDDANRVIKSIPEPKIKFEVIPDYFE